MSTKHMFYTVKDLVSLLNVSNQTIYTWIKEGHINAYQLNGRGPWRIKPSEYKRLHRQDWVQR
jgi:excisionase family DNA binding protein